MLKTFTLRSSNRSELAIFSTENNSDAHRIAASRKSTPKIFLRYNGASPGTHSMATKSKKRAKGSSRDKTTAKKPLTSAPTQPANGSGPPPSNLDMLRRMYSAMLKCRMMGERARDGDAVLAYDLAAGHEAIVIGASIDLKPEDTIAASQSQLRRPHRHGSAAEAFVEGERRKRFRGK